MCCTNLQRRYLMQDNWEPTDKAGIYKNLAYRKDIALPWAKAGVEPCCSLYAKIIKWNYYFIVYYLQISLGD